jgi:DNA processing protein
VIGGERLDLKRTVAIVGARNASAAGKRMTEILARSLGERGFTVVSGLARGIDAAAHAASLATGTVAVLAGGKDHVYPDENITLSRSIIDNGGMLITARLALEQDREVFAVPGSPLDQRSEGGNHLIQQGARLITSADDIVEALGHIDPSRNVLLEPDWAPDMPFDDADPTDDDRTKLLEALSVTPTSVDTLITATGLSVGTIQMLLLELDLAGRIEWSSGQLVALKP